MANSVPHVPPELEQQVRELAYRGLFVRAIRHLLEATGCSPRAAKGWVDRHVLYPWRWRGGPCPHCGMPLRTAKARQCFECGQDWHESPDG